MDAGKVAILGVMGALFVGVVIWIIYAMVRTTPQSSPSLGVVPRTYKKDVIIEQYSLLPDFINGQYKARFSAGAPHMLYPPNGSIKSSDTHINDSFKLEIYPGMNIDYYMTKLDSSKVFTVNYTVPDDIDKIDRIWLCDGVIVDNRKFIPNFNYVFRGNWQRPSMCDTMTLAWSSPSVIEGVKSDDDISCGEPRGGLPYSHNTLYTTESVKWKGAWLGMVWTLYSTSEGGDMEFGSVTLTDSRLHVLVAIFDKGLKMSSS